MVSGEWCMVYGVWVFNILLRSLLGLHLVLGLVAQCAALVRNVHAAAARVFLYLRHAALRAYVHTVVRRQQRVQRVRDASESAKQRRLG